MTRENVVRAVLRNYRAFQDLIAEDGKHIEIELDGVSVCLWDVMDALKRLPQQQRETIFWNVMQDKSQEETARIMGVVQSTVKRYVSDGCRTIAEKIL